MEYVYAALLLHKLGKPVDEEGIKKVLQAGGAEIDDSKVKSLVASLKGVDVDKELENAVVATGPVSSASGEESSSEGQAKAEEAPKEEKAEASAAGLSALFG
jgi:large subunit ribosomal protein L12